MVLRPTEAAPTRKGAELRYSGFDRHGEIIRSSVPILNAATAAVLQLCREIPKKFMTPAAALEVWKTHPDLPGEPSEVALAKWPRASRFSDWRLIPTDGHLEYAIACWNMPLDKVLWLSDPYAWEQMCNAAEVFHDQESRYAVAIREMPLVARWLPGISLETMHRELLVELRESDRRRGRNDANGLDVYSELMHTAEVAAVLEESDMPMRGEHESSVLREDG